MGKRRAAALILLAVVMAILLVCSGCIALEAHHECSGAGCPVCAHMHLCMDIMHGFALGRFPAVSITLICTLLLTAACEAAGTARLASTPVALRVRQDS